LCFVTIPLRELMRHKFVKNKSIMDVKKTYSNEKKTLKMIKTKMKPLQRIID